MNDERKAWDKRPKESRAGHDALMDYLRMGSRRSLRGLLARYEKQTANKPPTTKFNTISTWSNRFEWVKRASAYDQEQQRILNAQLADERQKLLADELRDYRTELRRFRDVRQSIPLFDEVIDETTTTDKETNTTTIERIIVRTISLSEHAALTKWRLEVSALGRRANGMPERITEAHVDEVDAEQTFKAYIGISPDDWDDDDAAPDSAL